MPRHTSQQLERMRNRNSEWAAAMLILETVFPGDGRVWQHVDDYGINFPAILDEGTFSGGETCLLEVAGNIFNGSTAVHLGRAFAILSDEWADLAIAAMRMRRG